MTLKELSQLYYLNREIEMDQRQLEELRAKAESASAPPLSDMPRNPTVQNKMERYVAEIVDLAAIIAAKQQQCLHERSRLMRYISGIGDSLTRQVFTLRFVDGLNWDQVAAHIGNRFSGKYVSNVCYQYLKNDEKKGV